MRMARRVNLFHMNFHIHEKSATLEALHHAVAREDYALRSCIVVTEHPDRPVFESADSLMGGDVTDFARLEKTPQRFRNRFLAKRHRSRGRIGR